MGVANPAYFQLIAAMDAQRRVALLSGRSSDAQGLEAKDYSEEPQTLGQHLKKRRRELGLLQREAAAQMRVVTETYANGKRTGRRQCHRISDRSPCSWDLTPARPR